MNFIERDGCFSKIRELFVIFSVAILLCGFRLATMDRVQGVVVVASVDASVFYWIQSTNEVLLWFEELNILLSLVF